MPRAADPELKIYSKQLGMIDLNQFLKRQGANMDSVGNGLWTPMALSEDGSVIGGWAYGNLGNFGWVVQMPKAFVCHINPLNPNKGHTLSVPFPGTFNEDLAHGDIAGPRQDYQP